METKKRAGTKKSPPNPMKKKIIVKSPDIAKTTSGEWT
jgi:hypothetical protein